MRASFQSKWATLIFLIQISLEMNLVLDIQNKNHHLRYTMCPNFQSNQTTLTFSVQICQKFILE